MKRLDPPSWAVGATLPSFAVSLVLAVLISALGRMRDDTLAQRA